MSPIEALKKIASIENKDFGGDWDEIEEAREIARQALMKHRLQNNWIGLTDEEIRKTDHHMVVGAYHYSFKQGARWAEDKLKEKNHVN